MRKFLSFLLLFNLCCAYATISDETISFKRIGDIAISPDANFVAYTVSQIQTTKSHTRDYFLYLNHSANDATQLLKDEYIAQPKWSPNGKILAYLTKKGESQSIHLYDIATKQHSTFISLKDRNISSFKWSPDGTYIAFVADDNNKMLEKNPIVVGSSSVSSRIYIKRVNSNEAPVAITSNQTSISQAFTETLDGGFDWSFDGKSIAFAHQVNPSAEESPNTTISVITLDNAKVMSTSSREIKGNQPRYSPDGKWIAYSAVPVQSEHKEQFYSNIRYNSQICISDTENFNATCLSNTFNGSPAIIGWSAASDRIYVLDWYKTKGAQIYALSLDPKIPAKLISNIDGFIQPLTITLNAGKNYFGFGFETTQKAPEIYKSRVDNFKLDQVTALQESSSEKLGEMNAIQWKSQDGLTIEGLLITPANYNPSKAYPLLVDVHGGPTGAWAKRYIRSCDEYGDMIIPICVKDVLDLGFIIFQPNYRGSSGYGLAFRAANVGDLGGGDYRDILSGINYLIDKGIADKEHLAIYGWSYGGYMTAWAIAQSNIFRTAVAGAALTDLVSFAGTSDIHYYLRNYLNADLWENNSLYIQRSPIFFSKNIQTPLLILHGKNDVRVPLSQANELYSSLKLQHKPVEMIVYPDSGHILTNGMMIFDANKVTNAWLKKALGG